MSSYSPSGTHLTDMNPPSRITPTRPYSAVDQLSGDLVMLTGVNPATARLLRSTSRPAYRMSTSTRLPSRSRSNSTTGTTSPQSMLGGSRGLDRLDLSRLPGAHSEAACRRSAGERRDREVDSATPVVHGDHFPRAIAPASFAVALGPDTDTDTLNRVRHDR